MSETKIRPARPDEYAAIGEVTVAAYRADGYLDDPSMDGYADELADVAHRARDADILAAVDNDGTVQGSVTVVRPGSRSAEVVRLGELEIRMLAVSPTARGRGIGSQLTRAVLRLAAEEKRARVVLCSVSDRLKVHAMYEREGFKRLPSRDWRPEPGLLLLAFAAEVK